MPAIQSKANFDGKPTREGKSAKIKCASKSRNKDRTTSRKCENPLERNARQKKKLFIPKLDLKSISPRASNKAKIDGDSPRKLKIPSFSRTVAKLSAKRPKEMSFAPSDECFISAPNTPDCWVNGMETPRSLFSAIPDTSTANEQDHSPKQLPDGYYDCNEADEYYRNQYPDFENSSECEYDTAKLLDDFSLPSMESVTSTGHSPGVLRHFKELLHQEESSRTNLLQQSEISLLKDIVKADERHHRLQRDDYELLKEILVGQLKEICHQERVIKVALKKIRTHRKDDDVEVTTLKVDSAEQPMEDVGGIPRDDVVNKAYRSHRTPRQEVDIIFRNVPSLEKEIQILRSLGMKLEETLNKSNEKNPTLAPPQRAIILHAAETRNFAQSVYYASSTIQRKGRQILSGQVKEFRICHQTIDELKLEREFYIPTDIDNFTLQRTDFHKLRRNPDLLLRRLRPLTKGSSMKFNFIEQDPIFFNHLLHKMCSVYAETSEAHEMFIPQRLDLAKKDFGCGDHSQFVDVKEKHCQSLELAVLNPKTSSSSSLMKRRKKKHFSTPMPGDTVTTPKNNLIRNLMICTIQLSMLLTLITALWYPEIICP